ncbi:MAG: hypothetical protein AAGB29_15330 [Planctomycetota bacterium]
MIAACFGLVGFAASCVLNTASGNPAVTTLWRSMLVMLICWLIGRLAGAVMYRVVLDLIERHQAENPIPDENAPAP